MKLSLSSLLAALAFTALPGCAAQTIDAASHDSEESVGQAQDAIGLGDPPDGKNGKHGHCLWPAASLLFLHQMASNALNAGGNELPILSGVTGPCREELLDNAIECALTQEQILEDPGVSPMKKYTGRWGLAANWMYEPLDASGRRWVSACMAQRLNFYGAEVPILLEGGHPALLGAPQLESYYPFFESIAYGDLFTPTNAYIQVCSGDDLDKLCEGTGVTPEQWINLRICDETLGCGLIPMGKCSEVCEVTGTTHAFKSCLGDDKQYDDHTVQVWIEEPKECKLPGAGE